MKRIFMRSQAAVLATLAAFGCILVLSGFSYAPVQKQLPDLASVCGANTVTYVALHRSQPATITCQQKSNTATIPATQIGSCASNETFALEDSNNKYYCFFGTGYLGYRVNNVIRYQTKQYYVWVKIYPNGSTSGCYYSMIPNDDASHTLLFDGNHSVTQVHIGGNGVVPGPICGGV